VATVPVEVGAVAAVSQMKRRQQSAMAVRSGGAVSSRRRWAPPPVRRRTAGGARRPHRPNQCVPRRGYREALRGACLSAPLGVGRQKSRQDYRLARARKHSFGIRLAKAWAAERSCSPTGLALCEDRIARPRPATCRDLSFAQIGCRSPGTWGQRSTFSPGSWGHRIARVMGPGSRVIGPGSPGSWGQSIARVMGPRPVT
jgi:hypothetical protein